MKDSRRKNRIRFDIQAKLHGSIVCLVLLLSFLIITNDLDSTEPSLTQEVRKPEQLFIGTPVHLNITITTGLEQEVYHPVKDTISVFSITDVRKTTGAESDRLINNIVYRIAPFETGEQRFPSLTFEIFDHTTGEIKTIRSLPVELEISSVLIDDDMELRDITGPLRLNLGIWDYLIPLALLVLLSAGIVFIWRKVTGKEKIALSEEVLDTRPPYQKALELLEKLKQERLLEKGGYLEYYYRLSYILRYFLELNFLFNAVEMTSKEIGERIKDLPGEEREGINKFLQETDLVKFAKYVPYVNRALEDTNWLENYLKSYARKIHEEVTEEKGNA